MNMAQGHKGIFVFKSTRNTCYSNKREKIYGRYDKARIKAYETYFVNQGQNRR